jgi:hypothetical protein
VAVSETDRVPANGSRSPVSSVATSLDVLVADIATWIAGSGVR